LRGRLTLAQAHPGKRSGPIDERPRRGLGKGHLVGSGLNGSLRYCIYHAIDGDRIQFGVQGIINLGSALPNLTQSFSIAGPGADKMNVRRDTGGDYRIFSVGIGATVSISGLTLRELGRVCKICQSRWKGRIRCLSIQCGRKQKLAANPILC
jgi:hypothetical protein